MRFPAEKYGISVAKRWFDGLIAPRAGLLPC